MVKRDIFSLGAAAASGGTASVALRAVTLPLSRSLASSAPRLAIQASAPVASLDAGTLNDTDLPPLLMRPSFPSWSWFWSERAPQPAGPSRSRPRSLGRSQSPPAPARRFRRRSPAGRGHTAAPENRTVPVLWRHHVRSPYLRFCG